MFLTIIKTIRRRLAMFRFRRKSSPDWDEIHQLFKQGALRQDRTDRQLEHLAQEQRDRDRSWQAKLDAHQAAQDKQRVKDQAAQDKQRVKDQVAQDKQRAKDRAAWEEQLAEERAAREEQRVKDQAAQDKQRAKDRAAWEEQLAKERAAREEQRVKDQAAQDKQRAKDQAAQDKQRAAWEDEHRKNIADYLAVAKQVQKEVGGAAYNLGNIAEEHFMQAWDHCKPVLIGDIEFDEVLANQKYRKHGREMECDLVLLNGTHIGLVEVKLFLHPRDVYEFDDKLKKVLPLVLPAEYRHLHVLPVMACTGTTDRARKRIADYGFALLRPDGQKAKLEIEQLRPRPPIAKVLDS